MVSAIVGELRALIEDHRELVCVASTNTAALVVLDEERKQCLEAIEALIIHEGDQLLEW